ncbi:aspartyl/asparaginyl beta-hydroxylase domain-containing protein [Streptomyces alfalfae]
MSLWEATTAEKAAGAHQAGKLDAAVLYATHEVELMDFYVGLGFTPSPDGSASPPRPGRRCKGTRRLASSTSVSFLDHLRVPEPRQYCSEHQLMRNEYASLPWLAVIAPLMPQVLAADWSHEVIGRDWMIQTHLDGIPAPEHLGTYPRTAWPVFFRQLGAVTRSVHDVRGPHFRPVGAPGYGTWSEAVITSLEEIAADLDGAGLDATDVRKVAAVAAHDRALLDEVTEPRLLTGDLWTVNALMDPAAPEPVITGVLDFDRTWFGDLGAHDGPDPPPASAVRPDRPARPARRVPDRAAAARGTDRAGPVDGRVRRLPVRRLVDHLTDERLRQRRRREDRRLRGPAHGPAGAMPATAELLEGLGLSYMWVRLARLEANAFLWEHRDYDELDQIERHRLHIPLHTNSSAFLVTGGAKAHMTGGRIWRLTPTYAHGVCNLLGPDRIHLIADVYADDAYRRLAERAELPPSAAEPLPPASKAVLEIKLADARRLAGLGYTTAAESLLLRLFYGYALPEGATYDLIAELHTALGDGEAAAGWNRAKATLLALAAA